MKHRSLILLLLVCVSTVEIRGDEREVFSLPDSVLLFSAPGGLEIVTSRGAQVIKPPVDLPVNHTIFAYPSLAHNGEQVAWGFAIASGSSGGGSRRFILGIRSMAEQEWRIFGDFEEIGATAFSLDGTKIAFVGKPKGGKSSLTIFEAATGQMTNVAHLSGVPEAANLSWAPNGKQLVLEIQKPDQPSVIAVADPSADDVKVIAKGVDPVWSPAGDWIAYSDESRQKCMLVHPDGTGVKVVRDLRRIFGYRMFAYGPVWSPDGTRLLLNEMKGEGPNLDIMVVNLASGKVTRESRNGLGVFGWAAQKQKAE